MKIHKIIKTRTWQQAINIVNAHKFSLTNVTIITDGMGIKKVKGKLQGIQGPVDIYFNIERPPYQTSIDTWLEGVEILLDEVTLYARN